MESFIEKLSLRLQKLGESSLEDVANENLADWQQLVDRITTLANSAPDLQARWSNFAKEKSVIIKNKGNEALASGNNESAVKLFSIAALLEPTNYIYFSNRSAAYCNLGKYQQALEDADRVVGINPQWPKGYSRKGVAHWFLNQFDEAYHAYEKGLVLEPGNELMKQGYEQAKNKVLAMEANIKGEQELAKNKPYDAMNAFDRAVKLDPAEALYWCNRSDANLQLGYGDRASADSDEVIRLRPNWSKGYVRKGDALLYLRRFQDSAAAYAQAALLEPDNPKHQKAVAKAIQEGTAFRTRQKFEEENKVKDGERKATESPQPPVGDAAATPSDATSSMDSDTSRAES